MTLGTGIPPSPSPPASLQLRPWSPFSQCLPSGKSQPGARLHQGGTDKRGGAEHLRRDWLDGGGAGVYDDHALVSLLVPEENEVKPRLEVEGCI